MSSGPKELVMLTLHLDVQKLGMKATLQSDISPILTNTYPFELLVYTILLTDTEETLLFVSGSDLAN